MLFNLIRHHLGQQKPIKQVFKIRQESADLLCVSTHEENLGQIHEPNLQKLCPRTIRVVLMTSLKSSTFAVFSGGSWSFLTGARQL